MSISKSFYLPFPKYTLIQIIYMLSMFEQLQCWQLTFTCSKSTKEAIEKGVK